MRVLELPPDTSPAFAALLPIHVPCTPDRGAGAQDGMLFTRKRTAAALILPPHKQPTRGSGDIIPSGSILTTGSIADQHHDSRSSSPDLCRSYKLVEPSNKAVSFGTAARWRDHAQDVTSSGGLAASARVSASIGSRRASIDAAATHAAPEPYSAEWWLLRTAAVDDSTSRKTRAGTSSGGSSSGRLRRGSKDSSRGGSGACPIVEAPLYAGSGGHAVQSATLTAIASTEDVSARVPADQQHGTKPPTAAAPAVPVQQAGTSGKPQQQAGRTPGHSSSGAEAGDAAVGLAAGEAAAAAAVLPRSRCALFPKARRFSDQQQQDKQRPQHVAAEPHSKLEPAAAAAAAASSKQGELADVVKHRAPSVCFARPSVRQQMQQLLEQRRRDREAEKAARALAAPAAVPEVPPAGRSRSSCSGDEGQAIELNQRQLQQQDQPAPMQEQAQVQQGESWTSLQQQHESIEQQELASRPGSSSSYCDCIEQAALPCDAEPQLDLSSHGSTTISSGQHTIGLSVTGAGMQLDLSAADETVPEVPAGGCELSVHEQDSCVMSTQQQQQQQLQQQQQQPQAPDVHAAEQHVTVWSRQQLPAASGQSNASDLAREQEQQLEQQQQQGGQQQQQGDQGEQGKQLQDEVQGHENEQETQKQEHAGVQQVEQELEHRQQQHQECQGLQCAVSPEPSVEPGSCNTFYLCGSSSSTVISQAAATTGRRSTTPGQGVSRSPGTAAALLGPGSFAPDDLQLSYRRRPSAWSFGSTPRICSSSSRSPRGGTRCPSTSPLRSSMLWESPLRGSSSGTRRTSPLPAAARSATPTGASAAEAYLPACKDDSWGLMRNGGHAVCHPEEHQPSSSSSSNVRRGSALADGATSWTFADVSAAERLVRKRVPGPIILPPHSSNRSAAGRLGGLSVNGLTCNTHAAVGDEGATAAAAAAAPDDGSGGDTPQGCGSSHSSSLLQPSWALVEPRVRGVPIMRPPVHVAVMSGPVAEAPGALQVADPWQLDAATRSSKPSWSFPKAPLAPTQQPYPQGSGDRQALVVYEVQDELLHPRRGLGVLAFGLGTSRWCQDTRSSGRAACITVYDVEAAWAYLGKHAPGLNMALASGRHVPGAMLPSAATASGGAAGLRAGPGQDLSPLSLEQLAAAVAATKPRAPVWSWGPVAVVRPTAWAGDTCWGQQRYYDVSWVLVRKRAAGCVPFGVQVSRPGVEQGPSTAAAVLGPGAYDPCYTYTERQTALQVLSFLHMLGRQDLQHPATAHQSGDAGDTSCGTGEDLVTAEDAWLRPRTKGYVDMQKVLSREAAEQLQAGARLLTSQIPLPDAHLGDVLRPRAPQVHIVEASEAAADARLEPSSALGPGYYDPCEPSTAVAAGPDFSRTMGRCGACPATLKAAAAATAGADSTSGSSQAPSLHTLADWFASRRALVAEPVTVLEPQWQAVKPTPPRAFIQPLPTHGPPMPIACEAEQLQQDTGAVLETDQGAGVVPVKGCLDWSRMTGRKPVEAVCAAPHADYRVEDIPLTLLAQHMSAAKPPTFATMSGRPEPAAAQQPPADRAEALAIGATHDQAAAWLAATRGRAQAAAAPGAGPYIGKQVGRQHQVDASGAVVGAQQAEDGAWVDYNPRWKAVKPRGSCAVPFDLQVDREVAARLVPGAGPNHDADTW